MNRGYGVQVTATGPDGRGVKTAPVLVVAADEQDALLVAAEAAGSGADVKVLRDLTQDEILEHELDLQQRGAAKSLAALNL